MKKAIVLLLALAMVGGSVFADDPALAISGALFGKAGVYGTSATQIVDSNVGLDLDFDYAGEVFGVSAELEYALPDAGMSTNTQEISAPYFNYAYGSAKFLDGMVKLNAGNMYITSYRLRNSMLNTMMGGLIGNNGLALELMPVEGLAIAANLPMPATWNFITGAPASTKTIADFAQELDFFATFNMDGVGKFYASYQMGLAADGGSLFNIGADLKLVEGATIQAGYNLTAIGSTKAGDTANLNKIYLVGGYKLDGLQVTEEVNVTLGTVLGWLSQTFVAYRIDDVRLSLTGRVWNAAVATDFLKIRVTPAVRYYNGGSYFNLGFQFDTTTAATPTTSWQIPVSYTLLF